MALPTFSSLNFNGTWRDYQQRVLDELTVHLGDKRLHIVAAPGSGKTVLGLEVMRRIGQPALVISPSLAIKNQWVGRLRSMFLQPSAQIDELVSDSLHDPRAMTVCTYQGLHATWKTELPGAEGATRPEFEAMVARLSACGPVTIILDEAHHLRREWWRALFDLRSAMPQSTLVALTATPPYDAEQAEWSRYEALCGPIDAEISVPELVRNGDLCPHQDYLRLSLPLQGEIDLLDRRRVAIAAIIGRMLEAPEFMRELRAHPWIEAPGKHEEAILEQPEFLSSILIFLHAGRILLPKPPLRLLGVDRQEVPMLSPYWLETLLNGVLFDHANAFLQSEAFRKALATELRRLGVIEGGRVKLGESRAVFTAMAGSLAKLDSVLDIARLELKALGDRLRMVVLSDHVRAADLPRAEGEPFHPAKLGAAPIFEVLRRAGLPGARLGVLTGSLVILPDVARSALPEAAAAAAVRPERLDVRELPACPGYVRLTIDGEDNERIVQLVTQLFDTGHITILVGTQALLGEGWDAPCLNTLVLANNVGSYMLSNQMRGRAIRVDPVNPGKVANIWHLATVEPQDGAPMALPISTFQWRDNGLSWSDAVAALGTDLCLLVRRFDTFEGVANDSSNVISNGLRRLGIGDPVQDSIDVPGVNGEMAAFALDRSRVAEKWRRSLGGASARSYVHRVAVTNYTPRGQSISDTLQYLAISGLVGGAASAAGALRRVESVGSIATLVMVFGGLTLFYSLPKLVMAGYLFARNGTLEQSLRQVGIALIESLSGARALPRPPEAYDVVVEESPDGRHTIALRRATRVEERIFLDALGEVLGPIGNPRYIIRRNSWLFWRRRADYHAVPAILGDRKRDAEWFASCWREHVGSATLIYTRTGEHRKALLRARSGSFAAGFQRSVDRWSVWR